MDEPEYTSVDFQLLFELRAAQIQGKPLSLPLLRIFRARGWVTVPPREEWIHVRAAPEGASQKTIEAYSYDLATPKLTPLGKRELALHVLMFEDGDVEGLLEDEMDGEEVDEADSEDEDTPDF